MSTTLDQSFLRAVVLMVGFKPRPMLTAQAALIYIALSGRDFTAADLPAEITGGSRHLAGAATGALIAQGLLETVGRAKSPDPKAKGRRLDVLRLPVNKVGAAKTWLARNGFRVPEPHGEQLYLLTA